jgi:hypothetical protein
MTGIIVYIYAFVSFLIIFITLITLIINPDVNTKAVGGLLTFCLPGMIICISLFIESIFINLHKRK